MCSNLIYLKLLEASQTAFEASTINLKAAEEAHVAAKAALDAASEAFKASSYKVSNNDDSGIDLDSINEKTSVGRDSEQENTNPDEGERDFIMLSTTKKNRVIDIENDMYPAFLLISSTGPTADQNRGDKLGLYRRTEKMTECRHVYEQEHDTKGNPCLLFSDQGVWMLLTHNDNVYLRAATPTESPISAQWQYQESPKDTWRDDPALTVTGLREKPSCVCELTISLSQNILRDIKDAGVAGVYRENGLYHYGKPVLQHSAGRFRVSVGWSWGGSRYWVVESGIGDGYRVLRASFLSQCPADPMVASHEGWGQTHWSYVSKKTGWTETRGITVKCKTCI